MNFNVKDLIKFKRFLHGSNKALFQVYTKHGDKAKCKMIYSKLTTKTINELKESNGAGMDVAMLVNTSSSGKRKREDIEVVTAFFVDFDDKKISKQEILELPVKPHLVTQSSPGKFHAFWKVGDCPVDDFSNIQEKLARKLGSDPSVKDVSRVMRVPGTLNMKYEEPYLAKIEYLNAHAKPVILQDFLTAMKLDTSEIVNATSKAAAHGFVDSRLDVVEKDVDAALAKIPNDSRSIWLTVGMGLHSLSSNNHTYKKWVNWSKSSTKYDEKEQKKVWSGFKQSPYGITHKTIFWLVGNHQKGGSPSHDEASLTNYFAASANDTLRFNQASKTWYSFDGVVWRKDNQAPQRRIRALIEAIIKVSDGDALRSIKRFATAAQYSSLARHAELLDEFAIEYSVFDKKPLLLGVENGVVDLEAGIFRAAASSDYITRQSRVKYDANAKCPIWIKFIKQIALQDKGLYSFIKRALGYTITGHADLQLFFLVIGSGGNGKGVLMKTVQRILGDYATSVAPNLLTTAYAGNANGPTDALAKLHGARMVNCTELPSGKRLDEAFIKQYAGGDEITARHSYADVFTFKPEGKLWISTNDMPEISATDEAMWRRLKPLPFNATFSGDSVDSKLEEKLLDEAPGILNWLIKAAGIYLKTGLGTCNAVDELSARMRNEADSIKSWMDECCEVDANAVSSAGQAYDSYQNHMNNLHRKAYSIAAFKTKLSAKGFIPKKRKEGNVWIGFSIKP